MFLKVPFGIEPEFTLELDIVVPYCTGLVMLKGLKGSVNLPQGLIGFTLICKDFQGLKEIFLTKKISSQYWQIKIENVRRNKLTKLAKNKLKLGKFVKVVLVVMVPDIPVGLYKFFPEKANLKTVMFVLLNYFTF